MTSTQLKWVHITKRSGPRKKAKAFKLDIEPIALTEGYLYDISNTVHKVTWEVLQEAMMEQQNVLGALRVQLQELQVWASHEGIVAAYVAIGTLAMATP